MSGSPVVSILIPTYNYAHFLDETINTALAQTYNDFELLIVDNNSADNTQAVVARYLNDGRVRYYKNETNIGLVGNWNRCLDLARGKYIKFLCADDLWHPTIVEKYVKVMEENPGVALVTCDKKAIGTKHHETITPLTHLQEGRYAIMHMIMGNYCWIGEPSSVMFRAADLSVGNFSDEYRQYVDYEMWIRLLTRGDCYIIPEILTYVRFHAATNSNELKKQQFVLCFEEYKLTKAIQQHKYNIDYDGFDIDTAVKERAAACIRRAMSRNIPWLYVSSRRKVFVEALKIAREEHMLGTIFGELAAGVQKKFVKQFAK